jgi:hypothetical protein
MNKVMSRLVLLGILLLSVDIFGDGQVARAANPPSVSSSGCTTIIPPTALAGGTPVQPFLFVQCFIVWSDGTRCVSTELVAATPNGVPNVVNGAPAYPHPVTQCAFSGVIGVP